MLNLLLTRNGEGDGEVRGGGVCTPHVHTHMHTPTHLYRGRGGQRRGRQILRHRLQNGWRPSLLQSLRQRHTDIDIETDRQRLR